MSDMGKILDAHTVRFERLLPGSIDRVWEHLTSASGIASWLCPEATTELKVGGRIDLKFGTPDPADGHLHHVRGIITECEPPHLLAYSWIETSSDLTSTVRFELEARGDKVLLVLTHSRLSSEFMHKVGPGWHAHLEQLIAVLSGEAPLEFLPRYTELFKKYSSLIAASVIVSSTVSPSIAASGDVAYKAIDEQRQAYLQSYDRLWREADTIQHQMDILKRDTHADTGRALDDLERELKHKYQDLHQIEFDIRDLDKLVVAAH